jgi:hypothetical protein
VPRKRNRLSGPEPTGPRLRRSLLDWLFPGLDQTVSPRLRWAVKNAKPGQLIIASHYPPYYAVIGRETPDQGIVNVYLDDERVAALRSTSYGVLILDLPLSSDDFDHHRLREARTRSRDDRNIAAIQRNHRVRVLASSRHTATNDRRTVDAY